MATKQREQVALCDVTSLATILCHRCKVCPALSAAPPPPRTLHLFLFSAGEFQRLDPFVSSPSLSSLLLKQTTWRHSFVQVQLIFADFCVPFSLETAPPHLLRCLHCPAHSLSLHPWGYRRHSFCRPSTFSLPRFNMRQQPSEGRQRSSYT